MKKNTNFISRKIISFKKLSTITVLLIAWFTGIHLSAQDIRTSRNSGYFTYIFKLTQAESERLHKSSLSRIKESFFHTPVDSFPTDSTYKKWLSPGSYLFMHVTGNKVKFRMITRSNVDVKIMNNSADLVLFVTDTAGNIIPDAHIEIKGKKVLFDNKSGTYRLSRANARGMLYVTYQGSTGYFYIQRKQYNPACKRVSQKVLFQSPLKYVAVPVVMTASLPLDIYRLAVFQQRRGWIYYTSQPFIDLYYTVSDGRATGIIRKINGEKSYMNGGYIAFNKTIYRPGDTVFWKAFMTNGKNIPLNKEMSLRLSNQWFSTNLNLGKVSPARPGNYHGLFVLSDTMKLPLDQNYFLHLKGKRNFTSGTFRLEDYELKNSFYTVRSMHESHYANQGNTVYMRGTDENNLALTDIRAEIIVMTADVYKTFDKQTYIPDTLWKTETDLYPSGETQVILPAGIFPRANLKYKVVFNFQNASNQRDSRVLSLNYAYSEEKARITFRNDSVIFENTLNGTQLNSTGMITFYDSNQKVWEQSIPLPFATTLNPYLTAYSLKCDRQTERTEMSTVPALVECFSERDRDSVYIQIENPRKLPLVYFVYHLNKEVVRNNGENLKFSLKCESEKNYYLSVHYLWNNQVTSLNYGIPLQNQRLSIVTDDPAVIVPGQKVRIKLRVTDFDSIPVEGADVLAYALTSKMPGPGLPSITHFNPPKKQRELINQFFLKDKPSNVTGALPLNWEKWNGRMQLDSITYFKFLYPADKMFSCSFPVMPGHLAYISPYIVNKGRIVPVYSVYANESLVFTHYNNTDIPYIFPVPSGKCVLRIRIPGAEITVKGLDVEAGRKYIMSFEQDEQNRHISIKNKPYQLTSNEAKAVMKHLMVIKKIQPSRQFAYIQQNNLLFPLNNNYYNQVAGPLTGSDYRFELPGLYSIKEQFEPGYRYEFSSNVVKMYENRRFFRHYSPAGKTPPQRFSDSILTEKLLLENYRRNLAEKQAYSIRYRNPATTTEGFGRMHITITAPPAPQFLKNILIFNCNNPSFVRVYGARTSEIHQLPKGIYRAFLLADDNSFQIADSVSILPHGTTRIIADGIWHEADSVSKSLNHLILSKTINSKDGQFQYVNIAQQITGTHSNTTRVTALGEQIIEGFITDQVTQEPLPGVTIFLEGTSTGAVSDADGYYRIVIPQGMHNIIFSYVGYARETIPVGLSGRIDVSLSPDIQKLEEVMVVGYGVAKTINLTGMASGISVRGIGKLHNKASGISSAIYGSHAQQDIPPEQINPEELMSGENYLNSLATAPAMRKNFSDHAFWFPALITDKNGEATIEVNFPDDITSWKTNYIAMGQRKYGSLQQLIRAVKPLAANVLAPAFLVNGDSTVITGRTVNYQKDSVRVKSVFKVKEEYRDSNEFMLKNSNLDKTCIKVKEMDTLTISYQATPEKGFPDGEERKIPVYAKGVSETSGKFVVLTDSVFQMMVPAENEKSELYLETNTIEILNEEITHVKNYSYLCNEQMASKLKCLLAEKKICSYTNTAFRYDSDIKKLIRRLGESATVNQLWGWWKNSEPVYWISFHVLEALLKAEHEGFKTGIDRMALQTFLLHNYPVNTADDKVRILAMLKLLGSENAVDPNIAVLMAENKLSFTSRLAALELLQQSGRKIDTDTLLNLKKETMLGNYYWEADSFDITNSYIMATLSMYRLLRNNGQTPEILEKIRNFFMEERKSGCWRNTYESALIIETILPDMAGNKKVVENASVSLGINSTVEQIHKFPCRKALSPGDTIHIRKKGSFPVYFTAYSHRWNPDPGSFSNGFEVKTRFLNDENVLEAGKPSKLLVTINVKKKARYVMIEVPIPAGCSYVEKKQDINREVHREYFKNKVCIFYPELSAGSYEIEIELLPRFSGLYHLNPARAGLMYFPVFYGNNGISRVNIK